MNSPGPKYVIVGLVPDPLARILKTLRRKFNIGSIPPLPPHITIISPFYLPDADGNLSAIQKQTFEPIQVDYGEMKVFPDNGSNVVYLKCEGLGLNQIRQKIVGMIPGLDKSGNANPEFHITIARNIFGQKFLDLKAEIGKLKLRGIFPLNRVRVYYKTTPNMLWQPVSLV